MKENLKQKKGITLIALVITIIVLLILAGVSIAMLTGQNGILTQAQNASKQTDIADAEEQIRLELINVAGQSNNGAYTVDDVKNAALKVTGNNMDEEAQTVLTKKGNTVDLSQIIEGASNGNGSGSGGENITVGQPAPSQGTINGQAGSYQNPTIPAGYIPINEGEAIWDGASGPAYNEGLVITDAVENGNEWVWVPVSDPSIMYEENTSGVALRGNTGVTTNKYSASEIISGEERVLPGKTSSYREPDLALYNGFYDEVTSNVNQAGFSDTADMAQTMVDEYNTMIESIEKYGGFYIGRYELTADGEKPGVVLTNTNWYRLYAKCKELAKVDSNTTTRMIWGCQWDVTCIWLADSGYNIKNSKSWGNHLNSTGNAAVPGYGSKQDTGYSESWKANNIYDLAGNCWEWTQETQYTGYRVYRGGTANDINAQSVVLRVYNPPTTDDDYSASNKRFSFHFNIESITLEKMLISDVINFV